MITYNCFGMSKIAGSIFFGFVNLRHGHDKAKYTSLWDAIFIAVYRQILVQIYEKTI